MTRWYGKLLGFIAGWLLLRHPGGALIGLLIGHAFDADWFRIDRDQHYRVLGLTHDASRLISQYHPDRLGAAASDLREQAERKSREINGAYDRIKASRGRK
jgi:hypothetical protein